MKSNFTYTFNQFLRLLNAKVTKTSANQYLESHPDEGSMSAYSDALNYFNIENAAAKITTQDLKDLPTPLITFLNEDGGTFTIIKSVQNDSILWLDQQKGWIRTKLAEFSKTWSGIVLFAEADKKSGEQNYLPKRNNELLRNLRIPLAISIIGILILGLIFNSNIQTMGIYSLLFLKIMGMIITGLLFVKSIYSSNELVNKLCLAGSKISCQSILDSPAAALTSWFSWSDAGFIYFYGSFFGLLFSISSQDSLSTFISIQLLFSATAIFFSTYSLYYQGAKAKMWCTLCLGVIAIFVFEVIVLSIHFLNYGFLVHGSSLLNVLLGFTIPLAFLLLFKNILIQAQENKVLQKEFTKLKSNPKIFKSLMAGQRQMQEIPDGMPRVILGNPEASHTITFVSNPLCSPCANIHLKIEELLQQDENIRCEVMFISNLDPNDVGGQFVRRVFSLPHDLRDKAVHEWFERNDKNFEVWNTSYKDYEEKPNLSNIQAGHNYWSNEAKVTGTPTLFFNGKLLPETLNVEDLSLQLKHVNLNMPKDGFANQQV